jgi:hypothetical protein
MGMRSLSAGDALDPRHGVSILLNSLSLTLSIHSLPLYTLPLSPWEGPLSSREGQGGTSVPPWEGPLSLEEGQSQGGTSVPRGGTEAAESRASSAGTLA